MLQNKIIGIFNCLGDGLTISYLCDRLHEEREVVREAVTHLIKEGKLEWEKSS